MNFTYFQALGLVVFNKAFFRGLQESTKASKDKLLKENLELRELLKVKVCETNPREDELMKRISTLQDMVQNERGLRERAEKDYDEVLSYRKSKIDRMERTIKSNHLLIRDLWDMVLNFRKNKTDLNLKVCKENLKHCENKVDKALEVVEEFRPKTNSVTKASNRVDTVTPKIQSVNVYA